MWQVARIENFVVWSERQDFATQISLRAGGARKI
jgi:hypothetical protein